MTTQQDKVITSRKGRADERDTALGQKIRILRKGQKKTLHDMAQHFGISAQQFQKYETGEDRLPAARLIEFCKLFGLSFHHFIDDYGTSYTGYMAVQEPGSSYQAPPAANLSVQENELLEQFRKIKTPAEKETVLQMVKGLAQNQTNATRR